MFDGFPVCGHCILITFHLVLQQISQSRPNTSRGWIKFRGHSITVAAVPGMVGGLLQHLKSLRHIRDDAGWVRELLDEAENERVHLMTFVEISRPTAMERVLIMTTQAVFYNFYFFLYLLFPKTAHRFVGYLEEEAVSSYTHYLAEIDAGRLEDVAAPAIAITYWDLPQEARLRDVVLVVRDDEARHRDTNHRFADELGGAEAG